MIPRSPECQNAPYFSLGDFHQRVYTFNICHRLFDGRIVLLANPSGLIVSVEDQSLASQYPHRLLAVLSGPAAHVHKFCRVL